MRDILRTPLKYFIDRNMHHLLRVLQGEVELQVVQAAAAPPAQQLQVSRVELHRMAGVEEGDHARDHLVERLEM